MCYVRTRLAPAGGTTRVTHVDQEGITDKRDAASRATTAHSISKAV